MTGVRFLFRVTLRHHDLAAEVWHIKEPQKLPPVLSPEEVKRGSTKLWRSRTFSAITDRLGATPTAGI
jgi:hypothetical protein